LREGAILAEYCAMPRAAFLSALFLAACASAQPAPISYGGPAEAPPPRSVAVAAETPARTPAAQEAPDWADGEGTPLSAYALQPEEAQPFDPAHPPRTHRVGENESLYDIAARYQVPLRALIDQNGLAPPYALTPGRELRLPPPRFHTVARGESFEDVARRYNVDLRSLGLLNRMQPPYRVQAGDRIVLPAAARDLEPAPVPETTPARTPALQDARFAWPLRGEILARFGAQASGARLDGVEIAGREGAEIAAAADGEVVYAGADLPAYGTLVLVRHADNYVTAYAYARRALVEEGQRVRAGQPIAELGPGPNGRARLLFQVRRGSAAVDPAPLLGLQN
jgi:murein DD-endopeptidase MepM/ murein hydrolase activator NlpD